MACRTIHRPVPPTRASPWLPKDAHLQLAPSQTTPSLGHCQRAITTPTLRNRRSHPSNPYCKPCIQLFSHTSVSEVRLPDDPHSRDTQKARPTLICRSSPKICKCLVPASFHRCAIAQYCPPSAQQILYRSTRPSPLNQKTPSITQTPHLNPPPAPFAA